jgi:hypothetical protein
MANYEKKEYKMKKIKLNPKDRRPRPLVETGPSDMIHLPPSRTDPEGWYTGLPMDYRETPTQDADDL